METSTHNDDGYVAIELDGFAIDDKADESPINLIHNLIGTIYPDVQIDTVSESYGYLKKAIINKYPVEYMSENYNDLVTMVAPPCVYQLAYHSGLFGFPLVSTRLRDEVDTFIVDKKMDYIFGLMIDVIIFEKEESNGAPVDDYDLLMARFLRKTRLHKCCCVESDITCNRLVDGGGSSNSSLCPLCHVLYTRLDSEFYRRCVSKLMKNGTNKNIDFNTGAYEFMDIEHLPFELVLFLCGNNIIPEMMDNGNMIGTYHGANQWVRVPLWFIALSGSEEEKL
jgi:hypothetical protein